MSVYLQLSFSLQQLLIIIILINSIGLINSTPGYVNVSSTAIWAQNATTVAGDVNGWAGSSNYYLWSPCGITISDGDVLYIADELNNRVVMVDLTFATPIGIIGSGLGSDIDQFYYPNDVFIVGTSLFVLDSYNYRIQKLSSNGTNPSTLPGTGSFGSSWYMFIDICGNLYVSVEANNKVIRFAPNSSNFSTIAGNGIAGAQSNQLDMPCGIFVDDNLTIYIADYNNNRIQLWTYGASSGKTVAGTGTSGTSLAQLSYPYAIVVDVIGYMYIADTGNNRIVRWPPNSISGICIASCSGTSGILANQLNGPNGLAFDSNGSLYVSELFNNRVQKFQILNNQNRITSTSQTTSKLTTITSQLSSTDYCKTTTTTITTHMPTSTFKADETSINKISTTVLSTSTLGTNLATVTQLITTVSQQITIASTKTSTASHHTTTVPRQTETVSQQVSIAPQQTSTIPQSVTTVSKQTTTIPTQTITVSKQTTSASQHTTSVLKQTETISQQVSGVSQKTTTVPQQTATVPQQTTTEARQTATASQQTTIVSQKVEIVSQRTVQQHPRSFVPLTCPNSSSIGFNCNISNSLCDTLKPCQNNGTCDNNDFASHEYVCSCPPGFNGTQCEFDYRSCKPNTCWNDGLCNETSNSTFDCSCKSGWEGDHCESKMNYCQNVICLNNGVCRPLFLNYTCECLSGSYSGRYCEITATRISIYKAVSKSFASVAITAMISVVMFVIIMDILKYVFSIDPAPIKSKPIKRKKHAKRREPLMIRFMYVNAQRLPPISEESVSTIQETVV